MPISVGGCASYSLSALFLIVTILPEELVDGCQLFNYLLKDLAIKLSKLRLLYWIL